MKCNLYFKQGIYTILYDANGGVGTPESQTKTHGIDMTLSTTIPTKTGYTFLGWSEEKEATTATYSAGATFKKDANTTLYAVWKINTYTITYNANGGSGAPASQTKTYGVNLTLSSTKPTRSGYTFIGWSTSSSATSATYSAGGTFTSNANTTLYAVWRSNTLILYDNGTQYVTLSTDYTSGWTSSDASVYFGSTSINILMRSDYQGIALGTNQKIDLSNYHYLKATVNAENSPAHTMSIDISSLSGTYYIAFGIVRYDGTIRHNISVTSTKTNVFSNYVKHLEYNTGVNTNMGYYYKVWLE